MWNFSGQNYIIDLGYGISMVIDFPFRQQPLSSIDTINIVRSLYEKFFDTNPKVILMERAYRWKDIGTSRLVFDYVPSLPISDLWLTRWFRKLWFVVMNEGIVQGLYRTWRYTIRRDNTIIGSGTLSKNARPVPLDGFVSNATSQE